MKLSISRVKEEAAAYNVTEHVVESLMSAVEGKDQETKYECIEKLMTELFENKYGSELMIPWSFFKTDFGKAIALIMANETLNERKYSTKEVAQMTGNSVQYVRRKAEELGGRIEEGVTKKPVWVFPESALIENGILKKENKNG